MSHDSRDEQTLSRFPSTVALRLVGSEVVPMGAGTFMWIQVTHFAFNPSQSDRSLLAALIASPGYAHDYASPFDSEAVATGSAVHGRWWRSAISPELLEPWTAAAAESVLQAWADDQTWSDPGHPSTACRSTRLQEVCALLRSGDLYRLNKPGPEAEHQYGWATGGVGFHEFIVVDRSSRTIHVIVASDD
ncbi:hypothetical protein SFC88_22195 [Nocardioides sp. HM23]|uniref:hypothetical protein n=1 Tax=Nocardioides bizhenqiangii TaxID=3095076 RepID=UPI002ACA62C3|nr:hypothetical protein [Nocardioides sp. HM23]MDZ5623555.1 hypothetical protein [Nocardioides sp. HM23]